MENTGAVKRIVRIRLASTLCAAVFVACGTGAVTAMTSNLVYIGTYTGAKSKGIYRASFSADTGRLTGPELVAEERNPSFLALHPKMPVLYAVAEVDTFNGERSGAVMAYRRGPDGKLTLLNRRSSGGTGPCHLAVDAGGKCVLVANYGSGSVAALPIGADGSLGVPGTTIQHRGSSVNRNRQAGPHAHFVTPDPGNRLALVCDLGLDKVLVYELDAAGARFAPHDPASVTLSPGAGPRHLAFSRDGRHVYVLNEMGSTLTAFSWDSARGRLKEIQTLSTLPSEFKGESTTAEVQIDSAGRFLYASNRGHDSIAIFARDPQTGRLTAVGHQPTGGKTPRHFALDPSGRWLLAENQGSDNIVVFRVDAQTGRLAPAGQAVEVGAPVCLVFVPGR